MVNEINYNVGSSPYKKAHVLQYVEGDYSLERDIPKIILSDKDKIHTFMDGETLQSIAFKYYGDSGYWYYIAEANKILNPFSDQEVYPGLKLRIPLYGILE